MLDHAEMTGAEDRLVQLFARVEARGRQQVSRQLLADELVVGHVNIEGADQVIAVAPGLRDRGIAFAAVGVGVADKVHPVAGEVLAEAGRSQQPVDHFRIGFR